MEAGPALDDWKERRRARGKKSRRNTVSAPSPPSKGDRMNGHSPVLKGYGKRPISGWMLRAERDDR